MAVRYNIYQSIIIKLKEGFEDENTERGKGAARVSGVNDLNSDR